jgi:farnesyl-diphosphate farnesyltransferase
MERNLERLLEETSRTFALAIPLLPQPTREEVTVAYLLYRVADTLEDAPLWRRERRLEALAAYRALLLDPDPEKARALSTPWDTSPPSEHEGYLRLLRSLPVVIAANDSLAPEARGLILRQVTATVEGMSAFVARGDENGRLHLDDIDDLRRYCYVVAGIVGELLTDLFLGVLGRHRLLARFSRILRLRGRAFGEGLQLVNILKDAGEDAREGRFYLPRGVDRAHVFELARRDLHIAAGYVLALQRAGAARGLVAFTALPLLLARATLDRVEELGTGAKLTRDRVRQLHRELLDALDAGRPPLAEGPASARP